MVKLAINNIEIAEGKEMFMNEDLQNLWDKALTKDSVFIKIVETVKRGDHAWPVDH